MTEFLKQTEQYLVNAPLLALAASFVGGVLASYTPCVYPMVPILVGVIGAKSAGSRLKGFLLSLSFVIGMAFTYAILGMVAALSGRLFGEVATHPLAYFFVANLCLLFGLSMIGLFEFKIPLPRWWGGEDLLRKKTGALGIFAFGAASGLIAAPCTVPIFGTLLTFAGLRQNLMFGFLLLFVFSLGMGTLLVVLGTFTGLLSSLPKTGPWAVRVKAGFGIFLLLVGEYFLVKMGQFLI